MEPQLNRSQETHGENQNPSRQEFHRFRKKNIISDSKQ